MKPNNKKGNSGRSGFRRDDSRNNAGRSFNKNSFNSTREMHKATCADCKKECQVPFKPAQDKPVYCRDCYQNHKKF